MVSMLVQHLNESRDSLYVERGTKTASLLFLQRGGMMEMFVQRSGCVRKWKHGWVAIVTDAEEEEEREGSESLVWWCLDAEGKRQTLECEKVSVGDMKTVERTGNKIIHVALRRNRSGGGGGGGDGGGGKTAAGAEDGTLLLRADSIEIARQWSDALAMMVEWRRRREGKRRRRSGEKSGEKNFKERNREMVDRPKRRRSSLEKKRTISHLTTIMPKPIAAPLTPAAPPPPAAAATAASSSIITSSETSVENRALNLQQCSHAFSHTKRVICEALTEVVDVWRNHRLTMIQRAMLQRLDSGSSSSAAASVTTTRSLGGRPGSPVRAPAPNSPSRRRHGSSSPPPPSILAPLPDRNECLAMIDDVLARTSSFNLAAEETSPGASFPDMLFDLCCSEHNDVVATSFQLLIRTYLQRYDLICACRTTLLIQSDDVGSMVERGRALSVELQHLTETFELWSKGGSNGKEAEETSEYREVLSILSGLRKLLSQSRERGGVCGLSGNGGVAEHELMVAALHFTSLTERLVGFLRLPLDFMCGPLPSSVRPLSLCWMLFHFFFLCVSLFHASLCHTHSFTHFVLRLFSFFFPFFFFFFFFFFFLLFLVILCSNHHNFFPHQTTSTLLILTDLADGHLVVRRHLMRHAIDTLLSMERANLLVDVRTLGKKFKPILDDNIFRFE